MSSTVQNIGSEMSLEEWENVYWKKDFTPFHKTDGPHTLLIEFYDFIFGLKQRHRIFVPLCGKTKSMLWLASKGHDVVGLEYSPIAVKSFFDDNGLLFECSDHTNSKLKIFKAVGLNITIFQGDIFDANAQVLGTFDVIWDRGSFTSIYPPKRPRYLE
uniref:thiopurine S-methyltransferase-like n=1 Tax=Styela clava TaxID=7725 RepID=UPI00193996C6|nr:thiopurine S-methyltransferase-like [Styela clava]